MHMTDGHLHLSKIILDKITELENRRREQEEENYKREQQRKNAQSLADATEGNLADLVGGTRFVEALQELNEGARSEMSEAERMALQILFDRHANEKAISDDLSE